MMDTVSGANAAPAAGLYCVKMRASCGGRHVSGAERIVPARLVPAAASALSSRALSHPRAVPDDVNIRVQALSDVITVPALPVSAEIVSSSAEGRRRIAELLRADGVSHVDRIMALFAETARMRGAMLLDADSLERLEPDRERGVRATLMDEARTADCAADALAGVYPKNHFREALVLASKVQAAPGIVAEICVSDDPDYVTGYVASRSLGYRRISRVKEPGDPAGGRIFLFRGPKSLVAPCIDFLQNRPVLVGGMPETPPPIAR